MPSGIVSADRQPASLLHSAAAGYQSDALPDRVQVRPAGSVQRDEVSQRNLRVMRGEEVVRSVPRGAVLPDRDQVCAVPGRVLLRGRQLCAEAVPGKQLLPAGVFGDDRVPGRQEVDAWGEVGTGLHLINGFCPPKYISYEQITYRFRWKPFAHFAEKKATIRSMAQRVYVCPVIHETFFYSLLET